MSAEQKVVQASAEQTVVQASAGEKNVPETGEQNVIPVQISMKRSIDPSPKLPKGRRAKIKIREASSTQSDLVRGSSGLQRSGVQRARGSA